MMMRFFFVAFIVSSCSLFGMLINPEDCVLNPTDILDNINSINEARIDDNLVFRNRIPYYTRFAGLETLLHLIPRIKPFMDILRQYQNTPFRKALLSLLNSLSDKTKDSVMCEYLEFFDHMAPLYLENSVNTIFATMRNKIYEGILGQTVLDDFMFRIGLLRYCVACSTKSLAWSGYLSSFLIKKNAGPCWLKEALKEDFDPKEAPNNQRCCMHAQQRACIEQGPSLFFVSNEMPSTDRVMNFSLETLDLSSYILKKNRSWMYDLVGIMLYNFDQKYPLFAVLIKEDADDWFIYSEHYKIKADMQSITLLAQKGYFKVFSNTFYIQRFIYLRRDDPYVSFVHQNVLDYHPIGLSSSDLVAVSGSDEKNSYMCPTCKKYFKTTASFRQHKKQHNLAFKRCLYCSQWIKKDFLDQHVKARHNVNASDEDINFLEQDDFDEEEDPERKVVSEDDEDGSFEIDSI